MAIQKDKISSEIVGDILSIVSDIIGKNGVEVIVNRLNHKTDDVKEVIFNVAQNIQEIYGINGGYAVFRQVGRSVAKMLMEAHAADEWELVMYTSLNIMGFADSIDRLSDDSACICNCVFYPEFLQPKGVEPIQHAICWIELGFIEGFAKVLNDGVVGVVFKKRDYENSRCIFEFVRS